ncbi:MAG: RNA pyrophosphohydrolase [Gammaproteobacteria bacterium]|nr:RNA pyrophosphohydrolase [Gammaproteobacteria bacterium]
MIEKDIYRPCVAIIIVNKAGQVLWCRRKNQNGWQFPQGGIDGNESPLEAVMRETYEEVGLGKEDIKIIKETDEWYKYDVPKDTRKYFRKQTYKGQKQKWFLAKLISSEKRINLSANRPIEFDKWTWVNYWYPLKACISFKREAYRKALNNLSGTYNNISKDT